MRRLDFLKNSKHVSILIVPDGNNKTFGFRLSVSFCKVFAVAVVLFSVLIIIGLVNSWRLPGLVLRNSQLKQENQTLQQENAKVVQLQKALADLKEIDKRLRIIAGVGGGTPDPAYEEHKSSEVEHISGRGDQPEGMPESPMQRILSAEEPASSRSRLKPTSKTRPSLWPLEGWVSAEYSHADISPGQRHTGIDIAAPLNTAVKAVAEGDVVLVENTEEFGNTIIIRHDASFATMYGHNNLVLVTQGEQVRKGQTIAFVGTSGHSSAPHLHLEIWKDGVPVEPREYLSE